MTKIKKNFIYNMIYQLLVIVLPIITIPIISRALGPEQSGIYSYTYSIVNYFMIFGMLGISNYGNRKIAKTRDNNEKLSKNFLSIYCIQVILNLLAIIIYIVYLIIFSKYKLIAGIQLLFLISNMIDISWLYFGLENFKKTVTRNIIIKLISIVLIVVFVKKQSDLWLYTIIMAGSTVLSQFVLWHKIKNIINFKNLNIRREDITEHLKGILILFIPVISYSVYKIMDKIMIGMQSNMQEVGYYEYAEKIISIPLGIINALGTVMLPQISNLIENKRFDQVKEYLFKSIKFSMFISIPCVMGLMSISKEFSVTFLGNEYLRTGEIVNYLSITILFTAWANVIRTQWLIPKEKDNVYISTTIIGAIINFIINLMLIPKLGGVGAAIGTITSEFMIMFLQSYLVRKDIEYKKVSKNILIYFIGAIIMFGVIHFVVGANINNYLVRIILEVVVAVFIYAIINYRYIKNELLSGIKIKRNV